MNERVRSILAQQTTKTNKIQQLLLLGLTRREVADLVTNGNYGFVHNVYKKMLENGTLDLSESSRCRNTILSQTDYTFHHRFGVEIEAYNCPRSRLAEELENAGIRVAVERYNHDMRPHWKLTTDSSLSGNDTFELVSPILVGENGLGELETVCWVLETCAVKVNDSCGLHIHMDAADFNMNTWKNLAFNYKRLEPVIDSFMPRSRRDNNRYCKSLRSISETDIMNATTLGELQEVFSNNRYYKLNLQAYPAHQTVEFRQHSGTINFMKIEKWIRFVSGMIIHAQTTGLPRNISLERLPFLSEKEKLFYKLRTKKLSR